MANTVIDKKNTMLPLGLTAGLIAVAVVVVLWANTEHDSIKAEVCDTLRVERTKEISHLEDDVKEVKEDVKILSAKQDSQHNDVMKLLLEIRNGR